jgi:type IV fimbrial biogenesis protein FimT
MPCHHEAGWTLLELLVGVALVGVLVGVAAPSFTDVLARVRAKSAARQLIQALHLARVEGLRRGGGVLLVRGMDESCPPESPAVWSCGWSVVADLNHNRQFDDGDLEIQRFEVSSWVSVLRRGGGIKAASMGRLSVNRWGALGGAAVSFKVCARGASSPVGYSVVSGSGGRIRRFAIASGC